MAELTASTIIQMLEEKTEHLYPTKLRITEEAEGHEFVQALQQAINAHTRQMLCDIAGARFERDAVPVLIQFLRDPSMDVRSSVADALGLIGDIRAGHSLLELFADRGRTEGVPDMVTSALGAVGYRPAVPLLVGALEDDKSTIRGLAAWSLGMLGAIEAEQALQAALGRERELPGSYVHEQLTEALGAVELARITMTSMRPEEATRRLLIALREKPSVVRMASVLWALGELRAREAVEPLEQLLTKYPKGFLAEHIRASLAAIRT